MERDEMLEKSRLVRDVFRGETGRKALSAIGELCGSGADLYAQAPTDRDLAYLSGRLAAYLGICRMIEEADNADKEEEA